MEFNAWPTMMVVVSSLYHRQACKGGTNEDVEDLYSRVTIGLCCQERKRPHGGCGQCVKDAKGSAAIKRVILFCDLHVFSTPHLVYSPGLQRIFNSGVR
jgi:hypothetical protein